MVFKQSLERDHVQGLTCCRGKEAGELRAFTLHATRFTQNGELAGKTGFFFPFRVHTPVRCQQSAFFSTHVLRKTVNLASDRWLSTYGAFFPAPFPLKLCKSCTPGKAFYSPPSDDNSSSGPLCFSASLCFGRCHVPTPARAFPAGNI